jgi:hypothetical protein
MKIQTSTSKLSLPTLPTQPIKARALPSHSISKPSISTLTEKARIRNYISLYSSTTLKPFSKQADRSDQDLEEVSTQGKSLIKLNSKIKNISEVSSKPADATLQRKSNDLLYEIQKAKSDKLELMRDVSTYEYEFSGQPFVLEKLSEIKDLAFEIPDIDLNSQSLDLLFEKALKDCLDLSEVRGKFSPEGESFDVKRSAYSKAKTTLLKCSVRISEIPCVAHVFGTKWLEELEVSILAQSSFAFKKSIKHSILSLYTTQKELSDILINEVLSRFYFKFYNSEKTFELIYDPEHGESFKVIFFFIRGFGKCFLSLSVIHGKLYIEVIEQKEILEVPVEVLQVKNLKTLKLSVVKQIVKDFIYFDKYTRSFYWQDGKELENVFSFKESSSNLLKEDYLKELLTMKSFKIIQSFTVEVNETQFTIELHIYKQQLKLVFFYLNEAVEIPQESRHFKFLNDLQWFELKSSPKTFSRSLELKQLIFKLFSKQMGSKFTNVKS